MNQLNNEIDSKLDEADNEPESTSIRYTHEDVMESIKQLLHDNNNHTPQEE